MQWVKVDEYHVQEVEGRFTICRANTGDKVAYQAWRAPQGRGSPAVLLATRAGIDANNNELRLSAIRELQRICEEQA